jgi:hypothetical protein
MDHQGIPVIEDSPLKLSVIKGELLPGLCYHQLLLNPSFDVLFYQIHTVLTCHSFWQQTGNISGIEVNISHPGKWLFNVFFVVFLGVSKL